MPRSAQRLAVLGLAVGALLAACASAETRSMERGDVPQASASTTEATTNTSSGGTSATGGTDRPATDNTTAANPPTSATIDWDGTGAVQEGHLDVPLDYTKPDGDTIRLFMVRHKAQDQKRRIGTLLVNPGGPGFGGSVLAYSAPMIYGADLVDRFDILAWDPRGTGQSEPAIDCIDSDQYDTFFAEPDVTPDDDAAKQKSQALAKQFADDCATKNAKILQFIGTNNTARDMDSIRRALGEDTISYFGFSYGSELGATWATLFPNTVRAAVLDGASDPNADLNEGSLQQSKGFEASLDTFLKKCSANTSCAFNNGGDASTAFDKLMEQLDANPIPTVSGRPPANRGVALGAVVQAMYSEQYWPSLEQALADAQKGDGKGLLDLFDQYFQRQPDGSYTNDLEAFQTITCMDAAERPTVAEDDADALKVHQVAPRLAPGETGSYFCTFFPKANDPRVAITGKGAGPILVMGTTGDPATPLSSTEAMAKALEDGRLVIVTADQHTGYDVNKCSKSTIDDYLVDPVKNAPKSGKKC